MALIVVTMARCLARSHGQHGLSLSRARRVGVKVVPAQ
jgi:hypothetical protein